MGQNSSCSRQVFSEKDADLLASPEGKGLGDRDFESERSETQGKRELTAIPKAGKADPLEIR